MKRLYIIVEGQTEQEFVRELITPYFNELGFYDVRPCLIRTSRTSKGGFVSYQHLKNDALRLLKEEKNIIVTTLVDYFRIPNNIPQYNECKSKYVDVKDKVECLEKSIGADIQDIRFIPYIQLHEFEAVLFSSNNGFKAFYNDEICIKIQKIIDDYTNPELINDSPQTAPSKRILNIIPQYDKVLEGNLIAIEVGMSKILTKCPRFRHWIEVLIKRMRE